MNSNQHKPRFREIVEGALGNVIGAILLAILGFTTGGFTIGWFPTFIIFAIAIGIFSLWYRFDPNLQGLIRQRFWKIKHAVSSQNLVMSRWNLITEETIVHIARQNNLSRERLSIEQSRIVKFNGQDHLELVLIDWNQNKWLSLTNNNGTVVDLYGGFKAASGICENCGAAIIVKYGVGKNGKYMSESLTTCRRCKNQMNLSVVALNQQADINVRVKTINKVNVQVRDGKVWVHIEFVIENSGQMTRVCPELELKIAALIKGSYAEKIARQKLSPIEVNSYSTKTKEFDWGFPLGTIILTKKTNYLTINLSSC